MYDFYSKEIAPLVAELDRKLGVVKIPVKFVPSEYKLRVDKNDYVGNRYDLWVVDHIEIDKLINSRPF